MIVQVKNKSWEYQRTSRPYTVNHHQSSGPHEVESASDYDYAIIVNGSRDYNNYDDFSTIMDSWMEERQDKFVHAKIIFISGKARNGADNMVIRWCVDHSYPWIEMPADWEKHGNSAGMIRNIDMAVVAATSRIKGMLVSFWDAKSRGTRQMISTAYKHELDVSVFLITPDPVEADQFALDSL